MKSVLLAIYAVLLRFFVAIYALLCGEKLSQKLCPWRKKGQISCMPQMPLLHSEDLPPNGSHTIRTLCCNFGSPFIGLSCLTCLHEKAWAAKAAGKTRMCRKSLLGTLLRLRMEQDQTSGRSARVIIVQLVKKSKTSERFPHLYSHKIGY